MPETTLNKTTESIIASAKSLFWKFGIRKVTVADICKEAGVSKMTFYRKFQNKIEVAGKVIDQMTENGQRAYAEVMGGDIPFPEKIAELIRIKHQETQGVSLQFINDLLQGGYDELQAKLDAYRAEAVGNIMQDMMQAQQEGWIRKDLKPEFILFMFGDVQQKMTNAHLQAMYSDPVELIMELTNFLFYGFSAPKPPSE